MVVKMGSRQHKMCKIRQGEILRRLPF